MGKPRACYSEGSEESANVLKTQDFSLWSKRQSLYFVASVIAMFEDKRFDWRDRNGHCNTEPLISLYHVTDFTPRSMLLLAEKAGCEVRHLWVQHGGEEYAKKKMDSFKA